jgi:hypothetical protein
VTVGAVPASTPVNLPPSAQASPAQTTAKNGDSPFAIGQLWSGRYSCAQGETELTVRIEKVDGPEVDAIFEFFHGPTGVEGSYRIHGRWSSPKHTIRLDPGEWIDRPSGYVTVAMVGTVEDGRFSGTIDNETCRDFSLALEELDVDRD